MMAVFACGVLLALVEPVLAFSLQPHAMARRSGCMLCGMPRPCYSPPSPPHVLLSAMQRVPANADGAETVDGAAPRDKAAHGEGYDACASHDRRAVLGTASSR